MVERGERREREREREREWTARGERRDTEAEALYCAHMTERERTFLAAAIKIINVPQSPS